MAVKRRKANYKAYCFIACSQSDLGWNANCHSLQPHTLNRGCVRAWERQGTHDSQTDVRTHTLKILGGSVLYYFFFFATLFSLLFPFFPLFFKTWVLQPSSRPNQAPIQTDSSLSPSVFPPIPHLTSERCGKFLSRPLQSAEFGSHRTDGWIEDRANPWSRVAPSLTLNQWLQTHRVGSKVWVPTFLYSVLSHFSPVLLF